MSPVSSGLAEKTGRAYPKWAQQARKGCLPANMEEYLENWASFFDHYADTVERWRRINAGYHQGLASLAQFYIPEGSDVLEVGSGTGDLLAATRPRRGVGVDISARMIELARKRHPKLEFQRMAAERLDLPGETFDYVLLSDLTGFLFDIRLVFERLQQVCRPETRLVVHWYSRAWQPILAAAEKLGWKYPQPLLNWTTAEDIQNLLNLADFEVIRNRKHILLPKRIPVVSRFANRYLAPLPVIRHLCLTNWTIARPQRPGRPTNPRVSVVCPCRDEAANIQQIVDRLPSMGSETELILVEGHSSDDTLDACHRAAAASPWKKIKVLEQQHRGKGDAVRLGFSQASGDVLMILDADASVPPEDLTQFYDALVNGKGEFINGCRLVYTMDPRAMRFLNLVANRLFALLLSALMGQPIKDSLCGTKVLWRHAYEQVAKDRSRLGDFDPFGDFDLLFGAARLNLKIVEVPIRYRERTYGETKISRFSDGWLLLRMSLTAAANLFFIG